MKPDTDPVLPLLRRLSKKELAQGLKEAWDVIQVLRTLHPEAHRHLQRDRDWRR